ncbi:MAG: sialate O-acetylesterase [Bacteroidetes bacterium]|nr:sialate O-acetylesterase [Bacteroidota bacterium]
MKKRTAAILFFIALFVLQGTAQIRLPALIRDSMILQRDANVNIWGWASPGEKIIIAFNHKKILARADAGGQWKTNLPATPAGGPYTILFTGKNTIELHDVLFGDVWFCSGQSNMVHQMNIHDVRYANEIATANYPQIRQFWVPNKSNVQGPQQDLAYGSWQPAVGDKVRPFSAVAYFFAKKIYDELHVPIGIINASVGGTPIEAWTSEEGLKDFSAINAVMQKNKDTMYIKTAMSTITAPQRYTDEGMVNEPKWYDNNFQPVHWKNINIPGYWEDQGIKDLDGIVWYRREVNIPAAMEGKPATIFLGRIVDADELYINGQKAGTTTYQYPQRRYKIAAGILKAGKNIFVIRVTNYAGKGGFVPDKPYCVFAGNDTVDLKGTWQYKVGAVFVPQRFNGGGFSMQSQPTALYNAMVAPCINYTIKGFCWYQGEANTGKPREYAQLQPALINDWRNKWQQGVLPFLYIQLPGFMEYNYLPSESNWAMLREAQLSTLSVPNTAMVVAIDAGEWNDIHPDNKKIVGDRLALPALSLAYGKKIEYSGPLYDTAVINGNIIRISFTHAVNGLMTSDGISPAEFAIAGADKRFVWAKTKIEGNTVLVWSDAVQHPQYVRYAWADDPVNPNLYNREGLPASPFQTGK